MPKFSKVIQIKDLIERAEEFNGTTDRVFKPDSTPLEKKTQFALDLEEK